MKRTKEERRNQAIERQEKRDKLSNAKQIAVLDKKFGKDVGATKERLRLLAEIEIEKKETPPKDEPCCSLDEPKFKVKKGQDPIKEKKKFKRQRRKNV